MNQTDVKAVKNEKEVRVALYCRLSKDDDLEGESASIGNHPYVKLKLTLF